MPHITNLNHSQKAIWLSNALIHLMNRWHHFVAISILLIHPMFVIFKISQKGYIWFFWDVLCCSTVIRTHWIYMVFYSFVLGILGWQRRKRTLITRFLGPTWGPSGADRTQVNPMMVPRTLLSGYGCSGTIEVFFKMLIKSVIIKQQNLKSHQLCGWFFRCNVQHVLGLPLCTNRNKTSITVMPHGHHGVWDTGYVYWSFCSRPS